MQSYVHLYLVGAAATACHIIGVFAGIHAIMHGRTSQGTVAWLLSLVFMPYFAVPLYLIFGNHKFGGYLDARRAGEEEIHRVISDVAPGKLAKMAYRDGTAPPVHAALQRLAYLPFTRQNDARLLIDGEATFEAIFAGIESASAYVLVQFFIIKDDELGNALARRLVEKARSGVRVYLLFDDVGSSKLTDRYLGPLRAAGVEVNGFSPRRRRGSLFSRFRLNFRNHRKIVVCDGAKAWIGGHNVGDEYVGKHPELSPWRDTHVELDGPAVAAAQLAFVEDWHWATGRIPDLDWSVPASTTGGDRTVLVVPSGPADEVETCSLMFVQAIHAARERVWIVSPYFVPDGQIIAALQLASLRGVDVRVLIPARPDHLFVWLAAYSFVAPMDSLGVKIYRFEDGFLHQKTMLVDDDLCAVGTANFDNRSFRINFEITVLFADEDFATQVREMLDQDFARSTRFTLEDLARMPVYFRAAARASRLLAPVL